MITSDPALDDLLLASFAVPLWVVWVVGIGVAAARARRHARLSVVVGVSLAALFMASLGAQAFWLGVSRLQTFDPTALFEYTSVLALVSLLHGTLEVAVIATLVACAAWGRAPEEAR